MAVKGTEISRRDFVRKVIAMGAAASAASLPDAWASAGNKNVGDPKALMRSTLVVDGLDPLALTEASLDLLKAGGVNCWHRGAGNIADFAEFLTFCDQHQDRIVSARTVREIRQAQQQNKIAHISGWQGAEVLIADGGGDGSAIGNLRSYHELGLRVCGIAYNIATTFGAGCAEPQIGLTRAGHRLVEQVHKLRIVLDVGGHTGEQTSLDALAMSSGVPVVCTHTNVKTLNDNPRCTSDKVLEAIARTGGVIGLTAFSDFHVRSRKDASIPRSPQASLDKHLDQYDYLKKLIGVDHIGLGPDFVTGREQGLYSRPLDRSVMPAEIYSEVPWFYVKGFERISELPNVTRGLMQRGWPAADIRKVLGENWLRVYEKVWGA